jgi:hypothetical protein
MTAPVVNAVIGRLSATVEELHQRVEDVVDLAELVKANILPKAMPAAWVLPIGEDAEPAADMAGGFRQRVAETVGVVLVHRVAGDATGKKSRLAVDLLADEVKTALIAWAPVDGIDPFEYRRARLLAMNAGAVFLQVDFLTRWYLRA